MSKEVYTDMQLDVLKELTNIGGGNAATSISQMIGRRVDMNVPTIEILEYEDVYRDIMAEDEVVTAIMMRVLGDGGGMFLYIINEEFVEKLTKMLLPGKENLEYEFKISAIKELVNVIVNSFLTAVSKMIDVNVVSSIPMLTMDVFGAILSSAYIESGQYDDKVMIIKNEFSYSGEKIESSLYFIPEPGLIDNLFRKIGF